MSSYGPWIKHDGKPVPFLKGKMVRVECVDSRGKKTITETQVYNGKGGSWNWGSPDHYEQVTRYQVWGMESMTLLKRLAASVRGKNLAKIGRKLEQVKG